jgi:hypothetical protein
MAFYSQNTTVLTTATEIISMPHAVGQGRAIQIFNGDSASIFIGGSTVTTTGATKGRTLTAGANAQIWINGGDVVYAISAAGTATGAVIVQYSA